MCVWFGEVLGCWCFSTSCPSTVASKGQGRVKPLHISSPELFQRERLRSVMLRSSFGRGFLFPGAGGES